MLDAVDTKDNAWPPWWLARGAQIAAFLVVISVLTQLGTSLGARALQSDIADPLLTSIRTYALRYPISAKIPPEETLSVWTGFGALAFVSAFVGSRGGRIAWSVFGLL